VRIEDVVERRESCRERGKCSIKTPQSCLGNSVLGAHNVKLHVNTALHLGEQRYCCSENNVTEKTGVKGREQLVSVSLLPATRIHRAQ
jgi:hypothetical protein